MARLYLGHWEWHDEGAGFSSWRPPGGNQLGTLDLRTLAQRSQPGGSPQGVGVFAYPDARSHPLLLRDLGSDVERLLTPPEQRSVNNALDVTLDRDTPLRLLRRLFLDPALYDPAGGTRWKPLRPGSDRQVKLYLGGFGATGLLFSERADEGHPAHTARIAVFREDYRRNRAWVNDAVGSEAVQRLDLLRRWTGAEMRTLWGRMDDGLAQALLPDPYKGDGWLPPATTIGDTFVEASNTTLASHTATGPNGGFGWSLDAGSAATVIAASDDVQGAGAPGTYRALSSLATDDHYAQADIVEKTGDVATQENSVLARKIDSTVLTFYEAQRKSPSTLNVREITTGTFTHIGASPYTFTWVVDTPNLVKIEADGSTIKAYVDGAEQTGGITDNAITGNVRTGARFRNIWTDNFEAADVAAGGAASVVSPRLLALLGVGA